MFHADACALIAMVVHDCYNSFHEHGFVGAALGQFCIFMWMDFSAMLTTPRAAYLSKI